MLRRTFLATLLLPTITKAGVVFHEAPQAVAKAEKRTLNFYGPTWCSACPAALESIKKELSEEFEIKVHKDYNNYPSWVIAQGHQSGWGYPMIHWVNKINAGKIMMWAGVDAFRKHDGQPKKAQQAGRPAKDPFAQPDRPNSWAVAHNDSVVYNPSHNCPNCSHVQYAIENGIGPNHTHRCETCSTAWYHKD